MITAIPSYATLQEAARVEPRHITEGAFKDRLGFGLVTAIAVSAHPLCAGLREMLANRQYVDLDRPDLPTMLGLMVQANLPEPIGGLPDSGPLTTARVAHVLGDPVLDGERP